MINIGIINNSDFANPSYNLVGDSGMDLRANIKEEIVLKPLERRLIPTGIKLDIPSGYEIQIRPRSGAALKRGLSVVNTPGTVDSNYKGEIGIVAINLSNENISIIPGERIAQMVLMKCEAMNLIDINDSESFTNSSERGAGGFGHTGEL